MKRFLRWQDTKFSGPTNSVASIQIGDTVSVEAGDVSTTSGADVPGRSGMVGTRKGISMPNIYTDSDVATEPDLKILEKHPGYAGCFTFFALLHTACRRKRSRATPCRLAGH